MSDIDPEARGWQAIAEALESLYGDQEPLHWGTLIKYWMGGPDPLDGISAYRREAPNHWHFVTFGFSELYQKEESAVPGVSGWGFELTFRLTRSEEEAQPPGWTLNFLQNLARYVFSSGNAFEPGHHMNLNGPIALDHETKVTAIGFCEDPELRPIETPNGWLRFLQIVGLTGEEYLACRRWNTERFLAVLRRTDPLLVTALQQTSRLGVPEVAAAFEAGWRADGSSTSSLYNDATAFRLEGSGTQRQVSIALGANPARHAAPVARGRLPFGRAFSFLGSSQAIALVPGSSDGWEIVDDVLTITLSPASAAGLIALLDSKPGVYDVVGFDDLHLEIVPSVIRSSTGEVVAVVGEE